MNRLPRLLGLPHLLAPLALVMGGCDSSSYSVSLRCEVELFSTDVSEASPGDTVTVTGTPLTNVWDTAIYLDQLRVAVTEVDRDTCDTCDECREDAECTDCSDCDACDLICEQSCVELASFVVPDIEAGAHELRLFNVHGQSNALTLVTLGAPETGTETGTETGRGTETGTETGADTSAETATDTSVESGAAP